LDLESIFKIHDLEQQIM